MLVKDIKMIAKEKGIKVAKLKKVELVRAIQTKEDNIPCFGTDRVKDCNELDCMWREDCLKLYKMRDK